MKVSTTQQYLYKTCVALLKIIILIFVIRFLLIEPGRVNGVSMEPTLTDTQIFLVNKIKYLFIQPERFDVVQLINPLDSNKVLIKRIIGLPGEKISFRQNKAHIEGKNGEILALTEPYVRTENISRMRAGRSSEVIIPEHHYFVLGDNRIASTDSRDFGPVHRRFINGKALFFAITNH